MNTAEVDNLHIIDGS